MFDKAPDVESLPERVYELCKLVKIRPYSMEGIKNKLYPLGGSGDSMVNACLRTAENLSLIKKNSMTGDYEFCQTSDCLKNYDSFRRYCNSVVWGLKDSSFYKVSDFLLRHEGLLIEHELTNASTLTELDRQTAIGADPKHLLGSRFWFSFLGFGYVTEKPSCIFPNMYVGLKDLIFLAGLKPGEKYSLTEFFHRLKPFCPIAFPDRPNEKVSIALSCALRELHDFKEANLTRESDAEDVWDLTRFTFHPIQQSVTHIVLKKVK